jgi:hypothetical protein
MRFVISVIARHVAPIRTAAAALRTQATADGEHRKSDCDDAMAAKPKARTVSDMRTATVLSRSSVRQEIAAAKPDSCQMERSETIGIGERNSWSRGRFDNAGK